MDKINIFKRENINLVEPHIHNCIEFVYMYGGEGIQMVNGKPRKVTRGDFLVYNIGEIHCLNSDTGLSAMNIQISPELFDDSLASSDNAMDILTLNLFNEFSNIIDGFPPKVSFLGKDLFEIESIIQRMYEEFSEKKKGYMSILFGYVNVILGKFFRKVYDTTKLDIRENTVKITPNVLKYIEENYDRKITVQELAKKSFYEPSYYIQIFKECFGMTPVQYIIQKRMKKAMELLSKTDIPVEKIITMVGYSDKKHFYNLFKHHTGLTPAYYRKKQ